MAQLLTGLELIDILQKYNCQKQINDQLTRMIISEKKESGQLRLLLEVTDCRGRYTIGKLPILYFEAAFDFRWTRASKIIKPGQFAPEQDKLSIGAIAAEQLTVEEFAAKMEAQALEQIVKDAEKIINKN
jgi:hypothetical protein